jgi:hypothetical protein
VQPIKDTEHRQEQISQRTIPQTHIEERHVSSDTDKKAFAGLGAHIKDTTQHGAKERTVVDLGERVKCVYLQIAWDFVDLLQRDRALVRR